MDIDTAAQAGYAPGSAERGHLFEELRAAAETGWDFSSRWFKNHATLDSVWTSNVLAVDLNSILYKVEKHMARFYRMVCLVVSCVGNVATWSDLVLPGLATLAWLSSTTKHLLPSMTLSQQIVLKRCELSCGTRYVQRRDGCRLPKTNLPCMHV